MPTVIEMVEAYLKAGNFDGLANDTYECGCFIGNLAPCGGIGEDCVAGRKAVIDDEVVCTSCLDAARGE
jgi:hypothetical protein